METDGNSHGHQGIGQLHHMATLPALVDPSPLHSSLLWHLDLLGMGGVPGTPPSHHLVQTPRPLTGLILEAQGFIRPRPHFRWGHAGKIHFGEMVLASD